MKHYKKMNLAIPESNTITIVRKVDTIYIDIYLISWMQNKLQTTTHRLFGFLVPSMGDVNKAIVVSESIVLCSSNDPNGTINTNIIGGFNCDRKVYGRIAMHIHTKTNLGYPSAEDIAYLVKNKNQIASYVIVTKWGIWIMSNDYIMKNVYDTLDDNDKTLMNKIIQDQLNYINVATTDGKGGSRAIVANDYATINTIMTKVDKIMDITVNFYPWDDLSKMNPLQIRLPVKF
jgi:hypothetical protein